MSSIFHPGINGVVINQLNPSEPNMRILFFTQYFPPEIGAAPVRAHFHAKKWVEMGHHVTVVTNVPNSPYGKIYEGYKNKVVQHEQLDGIDVVRLLTFVSGKKSGIVQRFMGSFVYLVMCMGALFRTKPDIVLGSAPFFAGFAAFFVAKLKRTPVIYELRDPWLPVIIDNRSRFRFLTKLLFKLERYMLKHSDRVTVIGKQMSRYIHDKYDLKKPPGVIYNGIIPDDLNAGPGNVPKVLAKSLDGQLKIAFIGNLGNQYDMDIVLDTAQLIKKNGKDNQVGFVIVGEGAQKRYLWQRVQQLELKHVILHEAIPYRDSLAVLNQMDLTLIPLKNGSMYDLYLPVKLFESLANGVPPLLCNAGEAGDIVRDSGSGSLFESDKPGQLYDIILDYLNHREKLTDQGNLGRDYVMNHFNRSIMAGRYVQLFESVLKERKKVKPDPIL